MTLNNKHVRFHAVALLGDREFQKARSITQVWGLSSVWLWVYTYIGYTGIYYMFSSSLSSAPSSYVFSPECQVYIPIATNHMLKQTAWQTPCSRLN